MKISEPVLRVLGDAMIDGSRLILQGQLERNLYADTNKVLEAVGGKWNKKARAHIFDGDAIDVIEPILLTGQYIRVKQDFGQFDSPPAVVDRVIELANITPGMTILEPSAGVGNLVKAAAAAASDIKVHAIEIDVKRHSILNNTILWGIKGAVATVTENADFLRLVPEPIYDRVIMNPPFARQADIIHVRHAAMLLKPGGRLVSVMSAGVLFRQDRHASEFRAFVSDSGGTFERLPEGAFMESGSMVNACIVAFNN